MKNTLRILALFLSWAVPTFATHTCTTCYIDRDNGNDSWDGTSKTFVSGTTGPWRNAPLMQGLSPSGASTGDGASGNAASQVPVAGDKYILKGGVIWPYTAAPWGGWSWSGTSSTSLYGCNGSGCIYVGNAAGAGLPAWNKGIVTAITIALDLGGWNPASPPTISCTGGGGTGAAANALIVPAGSVDAYIPGMMYHVQLTSGGSGYTSAPTCTVPTGAGQTTTLVADIDRAIFDTGALQGSPPDWSQTGTPGPWPGLNTTASYVTFSGIELRNILEVTTTNGSIFKSFVGTGPHSSVVNFYVHGLQEDCVAISGTCPNLGSGGSPPYGSTFEQQTQAIDPFKPYDEVANSIVENGDFALLGTTALLQNGICGVGGLCTVGQMGIQTGTQNNGPVSVHGNVVYSDNWQLKLAGSDAAGTDPYLVYGNTFSLTLYSINNQSHPDRRYTLLSGPATLISYNNIDHNDVSASSNQQQCNTGIVMWFFNEVMWANGSGTDPLGINTAGTGGATGGCTVHVYNSTLVPVSGNQCLNTNSTSANPTSVIVQNLHCATAPSLANPFWATGSGVTFQNSGGGTSNAAIQAASVVQSISTANGQGYVVGTLYAPTSSGNDTVTFAGANLSSLCTGYLAPLCSDINGNPRGASSWQGGAYVYAASGNVFVVPTTVTFGTVPRYSPSVVQTVQLFNTEPSTVTITSMTFSGTNPSDFSETDTCGGSLISGGDCAINITFTPTAPPTTNEGAVLTVNLSGFPSPTVTLGGVSGTNGVGSIIASGTKITSGTVIR